MNMICKPLGLASLLLIAVAPFVYMGDAIGLDLLKTLLAVGSLVWFVAGTTWMWNAK